MAFKHLSRNDMEKLSDVELADYLYREDAAQALADGFTRQQHIECYKQKAKAKAAAAWDEVVVP